MNIPKHEAECGADVRAWIVGEGKNATKVRKTREREKDKDIGLHVPLLYPEAWKRNAKKRRATTPPGQRRGKKGGKKMIAKRSTATTCNNTPTGDAQDHSWNELNGRTPARYLSIPYRRSPRKQRG